MINGRYKLTELAELDLIDIWKHIALDDPSAADRVFDYLHDQCSTLAGSPEIGRQRKDFAPGLRVFAAGKRSWRSQYLVFYRTASLGIEIVRVLEGHRNLTPDFFTES